MNKNKMNYAFLSSGNISEKRSVVVSECCFNGGFTVAQKMEIEEGNENTNVFMKGAFHIDSIDGLIAMRDALDEAIMKVTESKEENNE